MFHWFGPKIDPNEHGSYVFVCVLWLSPSYPYSVFSNALSSSLPSFGGCEKQIVSRPVDRQGTVGQTIQMRRNARLSSVSQALYQSMTNPSLRQAALGRSLAKETGLAANGLRMNVQFATALYSHPV
jgi:hypothetical protein